ncbi:MAG: hypothetical protein DRP85_09085 [Candidatus Makaraimicrobium thalassicum]|nr:MAG: hypothetical protein DRP85_09085 [Candidatus Omnitrophota bacterium]
MEGKDIRQAKTLTFRIPVDLYRWVKVYCAQNDLTISGFLTQLIETIRERVEKNGLQNRA